MSAGDLGSLRVRNRRTVLAAVQANPRASRADVARQTGLSTSTVSTLVGDLLDAGVLLELAEPPSGGRAGGRPATGLAVNPRAGAVVGIHLGHAHTRVLVTSADGSVLAERAERSDVDHEPARSLERVAVTAAQLLAGLPQPPARLFGVGVAVSAPVLDARALGSPPMLLDWGDVDIAARLHERLSLPVYLGNDATLGALAEWRLGAGRGAQDLVYVMLSEGVGAGLVLGGSLHEGATGAAGEFGHVRVAGDGQICRCGNRGCLETVVGARALVTALAHSRGPQCTVEQLLDLAAGGDLGARRLLADAGRVVGDALAGICTVLDPQTIVLGGALTTDPAAAQVLTTAARVALHHALAPVANREIDVAAAQLGARSEALGAALLAAARAQTEIVRLADAS